MNRENIDFICDTEDCIYWKYGICEKGTAIVIQEHCCVDYEQKDEGIVDRMHNFTTDGRMKEIANAAIDSFGELLNGRALYDALAGSLKMTDEEILAAGFTTLREFMEEKND